MEYYIITYDLYQKISIKVYGLVRDKFMIIMHKLQDIFIQIIDKL